MCMYEAIPIVYCIYNTYCSSTMICISIKRLDLPLYLYLYVDIPGRPRSAGGPSLSAVAYIYIH